MGYKIERIYIKKNEEGSYCTGLIGYLGEEGEVRDLSIEKSYIQGYYETGAIVGRNRGKIKKCTNESKVIGDYYLTGRIAGRNTNTIENCTNKGDIYGGEAQTGGIVGNCDYGNNILVSSCENYGNIDSDIQSSSIGGIIGGAYASNDSSIEISDCYNIGKVGNLDVDLDSVGGMVGRARDYKEVVYNSITIKNCINDGQVNGYNGVGGIVGHLQNAYITKAKNTGNVNGSYSLIGGITGKNIDGYISMSCNSGYIFLSEGGFYGVGGISGNCQSTNRVAKIEECYNTGEVYDTSNMDNGRQAAGIVANVSNASSSEYQSEILNCYNTGYIHGIGNMGGIASWGNGFKIVNCYNIGKLYCENEERGSKGGIICNINEEANNQCINNYWLDTCGASYGINELSSNEGAESKTESELKGLASILSDKYTDDKNNINNGYPILKWQLEENNN